MILKALNKDFLKSLILIIIIFLLDRTSKQYVIHLNDITLNSELFVSAYLNIILIWNDGIAFGLLSFDDKKLYNFITILIFIIIIVLLFLIMRSDRLKKFSYIFITGGAFGNLFDRVMYNSVPDFIDFHINEFHWFIFNVADIFISIGVICLIYDELFVEKKRNEEIL